MNTIKKIYISGKICEEELSEATMKKFAKAEKRLRSKGFDVFNPATKEWQEQLTKRHKEDNAIYQPYIVGGKLPNFYTYALLRDLMAFCLYDGIYMLEDWKESEGAKTEYQFAIATNKEIIFQSKEHAIDYLNEKIKENEIPLLSPGNVFNRDAIEEYCRKVMQKIWIPL